MRGCVNVKDNSADHLYVRLIAALVLFLVEHHMLMRGLRINTHLQNTFDDDVWRNCKGMYDNSSVVNYLHLLNTEN